jgi:hypothetical protein
MSIFPVPRLIGIAVAHDASPISLPDWNWSVVRASLLTIAVCDSLRAVIGIWHYYATLRVGDLYNPTGTGEYAPARLAAIRGEDVAAQLRRIGRV